MTIPCEQAEVILKLETSQHKQGAKIDLILSNQEQSARDMKAAIDKLTTIIMTDIERRMEVDQLKKDREIIYDSLRDMTHQVEVINVRNAKCDGAGIFENFPIIWEWYQTVKQPAVDFQRVWKWYLGELGWRRFIPALMTVLSFVILLYVTFAEPTVSKIDYDRAHKSSVGVP